MKKINEFAATEGYIGRSEYGTTNCSREQPEPLDTILPVIEGTSEKLLTLVQVIYPNCSNCLNYMGD